MPSEQIRVIRAIAFKSALGCATKVLNGGADVDTHPRYPATQEMRDGPSNSGCRPRDQTAGCCSGPMVRVVSESGKGGQKPVRCVRGRRMQVNR